MDTTTLVFKILNFWDQTKKDLSQDFSDYKETENKNEESWIRNIDCIYNKYFVKSSNTMISPLLYCPSKSWYNHLILLYFVVLIHLSV